MELSIVDGPGPLPDSLLELFMVVTAVGLVVGGFAYFTSADALVRFAVSDTSAFLTPANTDGNTVQFSNKQLDRMNWAAETSLGTGAVGDEDLFCGDVENGKVIELRPVDDTQESSRGSISGRCFSMYPGMEIDVFIHSQPDNNCKLSSEDKDLESDIEYTGILCREAAASPVSGRVSSGLKMWKVTGSTEQPVFEEVEAVVG